MLKLRGSDGMLPQEILKLTTSETASETTFTNKNYDSWEFLGGIWPVTGGKGGSSGSPPSK